MRCSILSGKTNLVSYSVVLIGSVGSIHSYFRDCYPMRPRRLPPIKCIWRCPTLLAASSPTFITSLKPVSETLSLLAIDCANSNIFAITAQSSGRIAMAFSKWDFGMISICTGAMGLISRKAKAISFSPLIVAGIDPETMWQNIQPSSTEVILYRISC